MTEQRIQREPTPSITESEQYTTSHVAGYVAQNLLNARIIATDGWYQKVLPTTKYIGNKAMEANGLKRRTYKGHNIVTPDPNLDLPPYLDRKTLTASLFIAQIAEGNYQPNNVIEASAPFFQDYMTLFPEHDGCRIYIEDHSSLMIEMAEVYAKAHDWIAKLAETTTPGFVDTIYATLNADKAYTAMINTLKSNLPPHIPRAVIDAYVSHIISPIHFKDFPDKARQLLSTIAQTHMLETGEFFFAPDVESELSKATRKTHIVKAGKAAERQAPKQREKTRASYTDIDYNRALLYSLTKNLQFLDACEQSESIQALENELLGSLAQFANIETGFRTKDITDIISNIGSIPPVELLARLHELMNTISEQERQKIIDLDGALDLMDEDTLLQQYSSGTLQPFYEQHISVVDALSRATSLRSTHITRQ